MSAWKRLTCGLLAASLLLMPGCSGCRNDDPAARLEAEKKKKEEEQKKKPRPDFVVGRMRVQPHDDDINSAGLKPGHWVALSQEMKTNNFDYSAEISSQSVDSKGDPHDIPHTDYNLRVLRPAALPKGQTKRFELLVPVPRRVGSKQNVWIKSHVQRRGGGREVASGQEIFNRMPEYQYDFLVLARDPDRYGYLKKLACIAPPYDEFADPKDRIVYYRVVLPKNTLRVPLPTHPLAWSSLAYIVWDGEDPTLLLPQQQQALVDWLHFGGQLIISGPESLDTLRGTFLDDYLPAQGGRALELEQSAFEEMNGYWSLEEQNNKGNYRKIRGVAGKPMVGVELQPEKNSQPLPHTGGLVVERRVGRGRVVATAFSLTDRALVNWRNFDGFFNACLLRRPAREFYRKENFFTASVQWAQFPHWTRNAEFSSALRYVSRDLGYLTDSENAIEMAKEEVEADPLDPFDPLERAQRDSEPETPENKETYVGDSWRFGGFRSWSTAGVAGWNDYSGVADAARKSLKDAAGITVPKGEFVLRVIAIYLVVLVPLNWGFFRLIGRVEWAWIAAPVIAIAGALTIVNYAQLDIGFARSRTEIGLLEAYAGYDRAHLTRYTALYTSLSTGYDLHFAEEAALGQPFPANPRYNRPASHAPTTVTLRRDDGVSLSGFQVTSNSTSMLHCEQMQPLNGSFRLRPDSSQEFQVVNGSSVSIREAAVLRRSAAGNLEYAWVGELAPQRSAALQFVSAANGPLPVPRWKESEVMSPPPEKEKPPAGKEDESFAHDKSQVNLGRMVELVCHRLELAPGEMRLIGWTGEDLPGLEITPSAAQSTLCTLVLVHLRSGPLPEIARDRNVKEDFETEPSPEEGLKI